MSFTLADISDTTEQYELTNSSGTVKRGGEMLKLKPVADITTPPDKFTYLFSEDGVTISANDKRDWFSKIEKHAQDNGYELPVDWEARAEDQLCRRLSGEWCIGGGPHSFVNTRFTIDDFARGTKVLVPFAAKGIIVSPDVAEQRALICSRCVANVAVPGCKSCHALANVVADAKGARSTIHDHLLKACGVCHCSNEAQVWIPAEFLAKGVTPEMMETYREIDEAGECWKYSEIREMRNGFSN